MRDVNKVPFQFPPRPKKLTSTFEASCGLSVDNAKSHTSFPQSNHMSNSLQIINDGIVAMSPNFPKLVVLGLPHLLSNSVLKTMTFLILPWVDKALDASQLLIMGSIANCTLSKRSEILDKAKVSDNLKDALIKFPLDEKICYHLMSKTNPPSLQSPSSTDCSSSCPRETQCVSRCSFKNTYPSQYRVGTSPISISGNNTSLGSPHVDLFATSLNYKVQVFMSPVQDSKAYAVDCMIVRWDGMFAYAFPPFRFMSKVLRKISADQGLIILIAQALPKQAWFPDLLHLSSARPLVLPVRHHLLSQIKGKILHPNPEKLHLFAWLLSGIASRREVFLNAQPDISPEQLEIPLTSSMMPSGLSAVVGVLLEPAEKVEIKFLSYKCCFPLALASGRRRSEIHAFSTADYCLRFNRDKSSVTLLTDPAFLAKNQIPGRGSEPIVIPALPDDPSSKELCHIRRTGSLRTSSNSRLFIPINKGKQDLSDKTISIWICKTIQLAYSSSNEELLNSMHVKAHDFRAISTSWALFNNSSFEEVLSADFWRTENSFISHYLQSLATEAQSLYSLGPLVSAQRVVFSPASSGSGDSALR
ncbi:Hypothetical predicted protein [Mytilus galloprovincialis]|uniref:Uncharacterized protein n=1 Tax=Mytilus galloprovincialis TaxID=29158 RepID=A0A8B6EUW6_MYTGA|nr:Hypothetical predicted protein [Mytilus galloprovincialis]